MQKVDSYEDARKLFLALVPEFNIKKNETYTKAKLLLHKSENEGKNNYWKNQFKDFIVSNYV